MVGLVLNISLQLHHTVSEANSLMQNIFKNAVKCKPHGVANFFISILLSTRKLLKNIIHKVNSTIFMKIFLDTDSRHRFIFRHIQINTIFTLLTKHLMIINKDNLYLHLKAFQKHSVSSCCVTSFLRRCPTNLTFLAL